MGVHSVIGASSYYRWKNCPGSVRLSLTVEKRTSVYADEGHKAHAAAEYFFEFSKWPEGLDSETIDAVKVYTNTVLEDWALSDSKDPIFFEHKIDLSDLYKGLFGTADCIIYHPSEKLLRVYDYKHGAGVAVEVTKNAQLRYYALGALLKLNLPVCEVEIVIVQPRCPHPDGPIRRERILAVEFIDFAAELVDAAKRTEDPNAPLVPGDHCRFCPVAGTCPALHSKALVVAKEEFNPITSYDPAKLSHTLIWLPILESWIKNVREFAYTEAIAGRTPPGFKLVAKRATRKWRDEIAVVAKATERKIDSDFVFDRSIKSVAQLEKVLGKKVFDHVFGELVVKESSGYNLAPEDDKREEVKLDAKSVFSEISD